MISFSWHYLTIKSFYYILPAILYSGLSVSVVSFLLSLAFSSVDQQMLFSPKRLLRFFSEKIILSFF
ncbi:hypothetical protein DsansV1_C25g0187981 [Dioscorea sansibarensis]